MWAGSSHTTNVSKKGSLLSQVGTSEAAAPLDSVSSADIAANIAQAVNMPEVVPVSNQADSVNAQISQATAVEAVVEKPQLVAGGTKSRQDIQKYTAQSGESVASIAEKFGVNADTIKWSNGITTDTISASKELTIPPRNGIVYQVKAGDTVDSLASAYSASKEQIVAFNDIEIAGKLPVGENILIPDGKKPADPAPAATYNRSVASSGTTSSASTYGFIARYGGNGYVPGYCTYYAASRVSIPSNWGNANTWDNRARASGWTVSSVPVAGAIFQTDAGWAGHVGIVEEVHGDGTITVSDMNGFSGFGRVGSGRVPVSAYPNYIYR
ncbi:LysM peptidoglycan-binding domain-containing protein [Candidatus Saccharibacteria bacterium]|jgi:surface antigen|nr:LysM peptidoglycan-binding domain-containing protein [Candidatus Saccharibacteria bacterium]